MQKTLLFLLLIPICSFGQKEFHNWNFGDGVSLNFNSGIAVKSGSNQLQTNEGTATVSDCDGTLLFYTDGNTVWNQNHSIIEEGTSLAAGGTVGLPPTQGALIVKRPNTSGIYFIFTTSETNGVFYSMVNMNANNGSGKIVQKNILLSSRESAKLAVTYHSNGTDIWVVTHYGDNNQYEAFLVTPTGISATSVSSFDGPAHQDSHGDLKISSDGSKIGAVIDFDGQVYLGDFNNTTGVVTGTVRRGSFNNPHGVEFSPDNSKMYINDSNSGVIQFDLNAGNNSAALSTGKSIGGGGVYGSLQLGPDGRIYVIDNFSPFLGIITNPNALGSSANFLKNGLFIGTDPAGYELTNVTLTSQNSFNGPNTVNYNSACIGETTQFSLAVTQDVSDVIWDFGDPASGVQNFSTLFSPSHTYASPGTYTASVRINYACGSETINVPVVISAAPTINAAANLIVCSGVPIAIGTASESNVIYSWSPTTGLSDPTSSNPTLTLTSSLEKSNIVYTLTATNSLNGCADSKEVNVELTNPQVDAGPDQLVCSEESVGIGSAPRDGYTYQWSPISGLSNGNGSLTNVTVDNPGDTTIEVQYQLTASLDGCSSSDNVRIEVKSLPKLSAPDDTTICSLDTLVLNSSGNAGATYVWSTSEGLSSTTIFNPSFTISNIDTGTVEYLKIAVITFDGCTNTDTASIKVYPQAGVSNYQYLCPGFGVALSPFGKGVNYLWSPNSNIDNINSPNPLVNPPSTTTYFVDVTDVYGCTFTDSVIVDVNPLVPVQLGPDTAICRNDSVLIGSEGHPLNAIYDWNPKDFITDPDSNFTYVYPDSTTSYIVLSQSDTCTGRDTIVVQVDQLPNVLLKGDTSICLRDSIYLVASGAESYSWSPLSAITIVNDSAFVYPNDTTFYIVAGTDSNSCVNYDTALVAVRKLPVIDLPSTAEVCFTDSIQVVAQGGVNYAWQPSTLLSDSTINNPYLIPIEDTRYIVTVQGANNCFENDTIDVSVNPLPVIGLTKTDTVICRGTPAFLWASGGVKYSWSPAGNLNNSNVHRPISTTQTDELYQVIVIDENNCIDSASTNVKVNVTPKADFSSDFIGACAGFTTTFTDQSSDADTWFWSFGDGVTSSEVNPIHTFEFGNKVTTQLIVGNNGLCFDTLSVDYDWEKLEDFIAIWAPNVITPNGDKMNDCFDLSVEGDFEACTHVEFYNRWGMKVYDSIEFPTCFKGINEYNLQELSAGTYFYVITVNDYVKNGFVQIIK